MRFTLHRNIANKEFKKDDICFAEKSDIPIWMDLMRLVIDGYPVMNEEDYLKEITRHIEEKHALVLKDDGMVIGTSAIIDTEIDGAVGMNSGIFNNPFIIWGRYKKKWFRYYLTLSFQFHHTQMDGAHAGRFLANLQEEINSLK